MELAVLFLIVGMILGSILTTIHYRSNTLGSLRLDDSDPDCDPYLFLELERDVYDIYGENYITLRVKVKDNDSHK